MKSSKRVYISIVYILLSCLTLSAETPYLFGHSAIGNGMGKTGLTYPGISQAFNNQALLSDIKKLSFAANYESRFNLKELATKTLSIAIPAGNVTLGTKYSHFGYSDYSRSFVGLAAGIKLSKDFSAGVEIDRLYKRALFRRIQRQPCYNIRDWDVGASDVKHRYRFSSFQSSAKRLA